MNQNRNDRNALVSFLHRNTGSSFRAAELKVQTGVPKHIVHELLEGDSRVTIIEKPKDTFHYQAATITEENSARKPEGSERARIP